MTMAVHRMPVPRLDVLVRDIEAAIASGDRAYQSAVVVRSADALTRRWSRLPLADKAGFDQLLAGLLGQVDDAARAAFAQSLTPLRRAPRLTTTMLACDRSISVAATLLERCPSFDEAWLLEIVGACGDQHRCAVARRAALSASLCEALIQLENLDVAATLLTNPGACLPVHAIPALMRMARRSERVALALGVRADLSSADRASLVDLARARAHDSLTREANLDDAACGSLMTEVARTFAAPVTSERAARFAGAASIADEVFGTGQIPSVRLERWIEGRRIEDVLTGLARDADLSWMIVVACYDANDPLALAVVLRGLGHPWSVLKALLRARHAGLPGPDVLDAAFRIYGVLSVTAARRLARYATARLGQSAFVAVLTQQRPADEPIAASDPVCLDDLKILLLAG